MSTISLRLPESLHKKARELARQENTSINQFCIGRKNISINDRRIYRTKSEKSQ